MRTKFWNIFNSFLKERRTFLLYKKDYLTYGNFQDDFYDQGLMDFYSNLIESFENYKGKNQKYDLKNPESEINLNEKIDYN